MAARTYSTNLAFRLTLELSQPIMVPNDYNLRLPVRYVDARLSDLERL